jgi:hypothetical protein
MTPLLASEAESPAAKVRQFLIVNYCRLPCRVRVVVKPIGIVEKITEFDAILPRYDLVLGTLTLLADSDKRPEQCSRRKVAWVRDAHECL